MNYYKCECNPTRDNCWGLLINEVPAAMLHTKIHAQHYRRILYSGNYGNYTVLTGIKQPGKEYNGKYEIIAPSAEVIEALFPRESLPEVSHQNLSGKLESPGSNSQ